MDQITKEEYLILRKCNRKSKKLDFEKISNLVRIQYLKPRDSEIRLGVSQQTSNYYEITHSGKIAYEHYHDHVFERRMVSFRAWLALALSAISIVVTVIHLFFF